MIFLMGGGDGDGNALNLEKKKKPKVVKSKVNSDWDRKLDGLQQAS